mmetsp:Transcript_123825/g.241068  ORF Transcript_123825/g.241068 Transcript_123825/m.241068 type:complete len:554 (+) Transcript_123825:98-1759(+)|eukprot:CAMPEP_0172751842 /NCGR_PEP_ID=MMETSP1074-20121228/152625_1 /TAXON_ID=2916 /ORGANISM="Ceratium fusus, Strain PA161109" /LENGTH=553 /DNA_ID=CAMNT_0013584259 /DNA_START=30 /DNA_END=1691 /DNA_ORIENTATION=+
MVVEQFGLVRPVAVRTAAVTAVCGICAILLAHFRAERLIRLLTTGSIKPSARESDTCSQKDEDSLQAEDASPGDLEDLDASAHEPRPEKLGRGEVLRKPRTVGSAAGHSVEDLTVVGDDSLLPGRQRIYVKTFGCPHNMSDGEYMMGQLREYGYILVDSFEDCDALVVNSCTVKQPSEIRALNLVTTAQETGKPVVLAGCVPSSDRKLTDSLKGVSMLDVSQLDRIVDVVEESIKGHTVKLLSKRHDLPSLALPKIRKDRFAEVITINAGCLGNCTYCKTKMARGKVISYPIDEIIARARQAASDGVCQIELASEDMGAYGTDIGTNIAELLLRLSDALPPGMMMRTGMTNPPFILEHIDGVIEALKRPNVHSFMHIPVQSGSDNVLASMRREYTVSEFEYLADKLKAAVPNIFLLTDIICAFPAESEEDWQETMSLCRKYRFHGIHISQFYARPGTPAARMKPQKSHVGKDRYRELTDLTWTYDRNEGLAGREERVWFTGTNEEHDQTVGRTKAFAKILVKRNDLLLGRNALVKFGETSRLHVLGEVLGDVR